MSEKVSFLEKFIEISSSLGINEESLKQSSKIIYGHERGYVIDFYNGIEEIIEEIEKNSDAALKNNSNILSQSSITQKVKLALEARIINNQYNFDFSRKLLEYYQIPGNFKIFIKNSWTTSDYIWSIASDKSLDWNYYSKRLILFKIYTRIRKFYILNFDGDIEKTKEEIDKSLDRVKIFNKLKQKIKIENIPFIRLLVK